jgi:hypothetical protein
VLSRTKLYPIKSVEKKYDNEPNISNINNNINNISSPKENQINNKEIEINNDPNLLNINTKNQPSISDRTDRYFKSEDNQIQNQSDSDKNVQRLKTITEILKTHEF